MPIVSIVSDIDDAPQMLYWGSRFANSEEEPLHVISLPGDEGIDKKYIEQLLNEQHFQEEIELTIEHLEHWKPKTVLTRIEELKPSLVMMAKEHGKDEPRIRPIARELFSKACCPLLLFRLGAVPTQKQQRILVPHSGGKHASFALELSSTLTDKTDGRVTTFFVQNPVGDSSRAVGHSYLKRIIKRYEAFERVSFKVVVGKDIQSEIKKEAALGEYSLVLLGASNVGLIRKSLFGTLPEKMLTGDDSVTLAIAREAQPLGFQIRKRIEQILDLAVPQLEREARTELFARLQQQARWNFDFFVLMALSTTIASLGLIQGNTSVVIGAMLVAPLMTPLLGAALALVQGNLPLLSQSMRALTAGFLAALCIGMVIGIITGETTLSGELLSRGRPGLADIVIAFTAGIAGAYTTARTSLSAALPGVAIAAALVPPIATTGIAFTTGFTRVAIGSALLFSINVVAILLGAFTAFFGAGIRWSTEDKGSISWQIPVIGGLLLLLAGLAAIVCCL